MPSAEPSEKDGAVAERSAGAGSRESSEPARVASRETLPSGTAPTPSDDPHGVPRAGSTGSAPRRPDDRSRNRPHAFPRAARLTEKRAYDAVFADNRRLADRYWTVLVHERPRAAEGARLGLAIAKRRARRANDRNRIKRVARESFRHVRSALGARHVVVMNRDAAASADAAALRRALDALWERLLRQSRGERPGARGRARR